VGKNISDVFETVTRDMARCIGFGSGSLRILLFQGIPVPKERVDRTSYWDRSVPDLKDHIMKPRWHGASQLAGTSFRRGHEPRVPGWVTLALAA
jgi:hypothetical protein